MLIWLVCGSHVLLKKCFFRVKKVLIMEWEQAALRYALLPKMKNEYETATHSVDSENETGSYVWERNVKHKQSNISAYLMQPMQMLDNLRTKVWWHSFVFLQTSKAAVVCYCPDRSSAATETQTLTWAWDVTFNLSFSGKQTKETNRRGNQRVTPTGTPLMY